MLNYEDTTNQTIIAESAIPEGELISLNWDQFKFIFALVSVNLVLGLTSMFVTQVPSFLGTSTAIGKSLRIFICMLIDAWHG